MVDSDNSPIGTIIKSPEILKVVRYYHRNKKIKKQLKSYRLQKCMFLIHIRLKICV